MNASPWWIAGAFYALWLIAGFLLSWWRWRICWIKTWKGPLAVARLASGLFWIHQFLPLGLIPLFYSLWRNLLLGPRVGCMLAFLAPYAALQTLLGWYRSRWERASSGCDDPDNRARAIRMEMRIVLIFTTVFAALAGIRLFPHSPVGMALIAIFAQIVGRKNFLWEGRISGPFEDTPLRDEILQILRVFGRTPKTLHLQSRCRRGGTLGIPLVNSDVQHSRNPRARIPIENLQCLDPSTFTAALAIYLARYTKPNSTRLERISFLLIVLSYVAFVIVAFYLVQVRPSSGILGCATVLAVAAMIGFSLFVFCRAKGVIVGAHNRLWNAYSIWRRFAPEGERTPVGFFHALAEHHGFTRAIADPQLVLHQLLLDPACIHFLKCFPPEEYQQALQLPSEVAVIAHARDVAGEAAGEGK